MADFFADCDLQCEECGEVLMTIFGGVPTTPDPSSSAKVSRCKWEAYRDTDWWCIYYFLPGGRHTFAKVSR